MKRHDDARLLLPDLPRMLHLPFEPNTDRDDLVATEAEAQVIFNPSRVVVVEEKIDGTQVGLNFSGDVPLVRNKNHVLDKGYGRKNTPAKKQYAPLWNWVYEHAEKFERLESTLGGAASVYGEWIYAEHTIRYDLAPSDFIAWGVYDVEGGHMIGHGHRGSAGGHFIDPDDARRLLVHAGFAVPPSLMSIGRPVEYAPLQYLTMMPSAWSSRDFREGLVVKVGDGDQLFRSFKMRRPDFKPRENFNGRLIRRGG